MQIVNETKSTIHRLIAQERPCTILAIGNSASFRKGFFPWEQNSSSARGPHGTARCAVTRFSHSFSGCEQLADLDVLFQSDEWLALPFYDMVLVADLFEEVPVPLALQALDRLLEKAQKQVLVVCPKLCVGSAGGVNNGVQSYHPVVFRQYDFTWQLLGREHENQTQLYSFYPKRQQMRVQTAATPAQNIAHRRPLRLAYILPDQDLTGGMKQLLMQIKEMHRRGHQVFVYTKSERAQSALPKWSEMTESDIDRQLVLKPDELYGEHIGPADAIILGWMEQVPQVRGVQAPVFLWEQGSSPLFGDFGKPLASASVALARFRACYRPPVRLLAVSPLVQTILWARFGRESAVVGAAVEPMPALPEQLNHKVKQILLVGSGEREFKNFRFIIEALMKAKSRGVQFEVQWITPTQPSRDMVPKSLRVEYHIAPQQDKLAALYQGADLFLSHSLYEAFSLPPLEAMAAGTAVLAVNNCGIETYAVPGENCLLLEQGDMPGVVDGIELLLRDDGLRGHLAANGLVTAGRFTVRNMCDHLENNLYLTE